MAAMAQASAMASAFAQLTPSVTPPSSGTCENTVPRNSENSPGSIVPAVSQTVTVEAPAAMAARSMSHRNAGSARVASSAMNSTSEQTALQAPTVCVTASSMAAGFLPARYSICTALTGAAT